MIGGHDELTLEKIDFEWVKNETKIPRLKKALKLLEQDGNYFTDLVSAVQNRMIQIDPSFKKKEFNNYVDPNVKKEIQQDIGNWTDQVNQSQSKEIFEADKSKVSKDEAKKLADNEKIKGNEALKSNDYQEALKYYTKSIEYDRNLTASYCNRALVYLKLKDYQNVIKDCNTAISQQSNYVKAFHRRAKAQFALKEYGKAYLDFKYVLEEEPDNREVNGELRECQKLLSEHEINSIENKNFIEQQGGFKKVEIMEENEEEEEIPVSKNERRLNYFEVELKAIGVKKAEAKDLIKKGMYNDAIRMLRDCLIKNQQILDQITIKKEKEFLITERATCLANMSLSHMQLSEYQRVIEFCSLIFEDEECLLETNRDLLIKSYLRRALAYEAIEKLVKSKSDFISVKNLDPGNIQASQGLSRLSKIMSTDENEQFKKERAVDEAKEQEQRQRFVETNEKLKVEQLPEVQKKVQFQDPKPKQELIDIEGITNSLLEIKDLGNKFFKEKKIQDAIEVFQKGVDYFEDKTKNAQYNQNSQACQTYLVLLTNQCLCLSQLSQNQEIIKIGTKVLSIDPNNLKALYRRGIAYSAVVQSSQDPEEDNLQYYEQQNELIEIGRKDLEKVVFLEPKNQQAKDKLLEMQNKNIQLRLKLKDLRLKQQPKQEELKQQEKKEKVQSEEEQQQKQSKQSAKVAQNLSRSQLNEITENITKTVIEKMLDSPIPDNASQFEKNIQSLKKATPQQLLKYIERLTINQIKSLYAKNDLPPIIFLQILNQLQKIEQGNDERIACNKILLIFKDIFNILPYTNKFYLCLKSLTKQEKSGLKEMLDNLQIEEKAKQELLENYNL